MNIKVDENLPIEVARVFSDAGHDALSVVDQDMSGAKDQVLLAKCKDEERVLVTLDVGFGDIRSYEHSEYPGVIVLRLQRHDKDHVLNIVNRLLEPIKAEDLEGNLWIVDESRIRIRG